MLQLTNSSYLDWDCILQLFFTYTILISRKRLYFQCYAAYTILISRLRLYLQCDAAYTMLITWLRMYFVMLSAHTILISRLRLYFGMLCLQNLDISTESVPCNAMLLKQSWYLGPDCILQCFAAHTILKSRLRLYFAMLCLHYLDISTETVFCNAMLPTPSCISRLRLHFAMLCCVHHLYISTETVFCITTQ